jgi:RHS repeat-associated protein
MKAYFSSLLALSIAFAISAFAQSTPSGYNTTGALSLESQASGPIGQTDFQTDPFTGRFEYAIPLELAPSRHDSGVNLELIYNSANGNSWCGVGWDLDLGYIERESKYGVPIQWSGNKPLSPMAYDDTKGFLFSFKNKTSDLVNVGGTSWRAQVQSDFLQFNYYSSTNTWIVIDKSGNQYIFGSSSASRMTNPKSGWSSSGDSNTWRWALDTIITPTGDTVTISYTSAGGRLYPQYYKYNGHTAGITPLCQVQFYLTSTNRTDTTLSCRSGYIVTNQYLLSAMTHTVNGQLVWSNKLNYTTSGSTDRSLLTSITRYGTDGSTTLPPLTFNYSQQSFSFQTSSKWTNLFAPATGSNNTDIAYYFGFNNPYTDLIDVDGDGLPDRVIAPFSTDSTNWWVQHNNGSNGFSNATIWNIGVQSNSTYSTKTDPTWAQFNTHGRVVDFNGDGWPDFIVDPLEMFTGGGYTRQVVQLNNSTNLLGQFSWTNVIDQHINPYNNTTAYQAVEDELAGQGQVAMLDMNGDGLPDRVMTLPGGTYNYYYVQFNTGTGYTTTNLFGPYSSQGYSTDLNWAGLSGNLGYNPETGGAAASMRMFDINGDGLPDRVMLVHSTSSSGAAPASSQTYLVVELNNGYGFEPAVNWTNVNSYSGLTCGGGTTSGIQDLGDDYQVAYRDINGDGLPDRIIACQCSYSGGTQVGYTNWFVQINTGTGFGPLINWGPIHSQGQTLLEDYCGIQSTGVISPTGLTSGITMLLDINGDGLPDRVEYVYNASVNSNYYFVELSSGPVPDLMTIASNGLGGVVSAAYQPATHWDNRETTNSSPSRYLLPFPLPTVSSISVGDGIYSSNTTTYSYTGGMWNYALHQFNGFAQTTVIDPLGLTTTHWFHQAGGRNNSTFGEYNDSTTAIGKMGMEYRTDLFGSDGNPYRMRLNQVTENIISSVEHFANVTQAIDVEYPASSSGYYRATAKQYSYDLGNGNLTNEIDWGQVTNIVVNGQSFSDVSGDTVYHITKFASLSNPNIVNKPQSITLSTDSAGVNILRQQTNGYEGSTGNLLQECNLICPSGDYRTTSYTYDSTYHNKSSETGPDGVTTQITYDSTFETFPTQFATATNYITTTTYDSRSGKLFHAVSPQGLVTSNRYDAFLRLAETDASSTSNGPTSWVEKYTYTLGLSSGVPANSALRQESDGVDTSNGHQTITWYDGLARIIQLRKESETSGTYRVVDTAYDQRGNVEFTSLPYQSSSGTSHSIPANGLGSLRTYDPIGRSIQLGPVTATFNSSAVLTGTSSSSGDTGSPVGSSGINYFYGGDPWTIGVTNENSKVHQYVLDAYGRTNKVIEITSGGNFSTTYGYNLAGDILSVTDNAANVVQYSNNMLGEVIAMADPDMGVWLYQRDYAGRIRGQIDGNNQRITNNYSTDPLGRLLNRQVYDLKGNFYYGVTNVYDSNGGDTSFPVYPGQLYKTIDSEGYTKYGYDVRGRKIITARYLSKNGMTYTNQYAYDDMDRVRSIIYPNNGPTVTNMYDNGANLYKVQQVGGAGTTYYYASSFTPLDQIAGITYGNGLTASYSYYSNSKRLETLSTSGSMQSLTYTYDQMADILSITDGVNGSHTDGSSAAITSANYDDLQRLLGFTRSPTSQNVSCTYNSIGNILTYNENGSGSYTYTPSSGTHLPHAVKNANGLNYAYDLCGNMLVRGTEALMYNPENRLIALAVSNQVTTFGYDAGGNRLWKQGAPTNSLQVWIDGNYEEKDGKVLFHVLAGDRVVCTIDSGGSFTIYYHPDHLHSAEILSTSSGGSYQHYEYAAYGNSRFTSSSSAFSITRRYASQSFDEETGLYYFGSRYYDPVIGRFIQPDLTIPSLFNPQAYDRYAYCYDNPLKYFDPDGHAGYWADVGQVWLGYYDSGAGFVRGSVFAVAHPITTIEGVGTAVAHPIDTVTSIGNAVGQEWNSGLRGQGDVVGTALIAVGTAIAPGAEASSVSKASQVASTTSKAEEAGTAIQTTAKATSQAEAGATKAESYSGRYGNGQRAYRSNVPRDANNNPIPDPQAQGAHSRLQFDKKDPSRVYSATEFDANGNPVKRIDFSGRKGDPIPHQHMYDPATKGFDPQKLPVQTDTPAAPSGDE